MMDLFVTHSHTKFLRILRLKCYVCVQNFSKGINNNLIDKILPQILFDEKKKLKSNYFHIKFCYT